MGWCSRTCVARARSPGPYLGQYFDPWRLWNLCWAYPWENQRNAPNPALCVGGGRGGGKERGVGSISEGSFSPGPKRPTGAAPPAHSLWASGKRTSGWKF